MAIDFTYVLKSFPEIQRHYLLFTIAFPQIKYSLVFIKDSGSGCLSSNNSVVSLASLASLESLESLASLGNL